MPVEDLMWVEKYRPTSLDDLVDQETIRQRLKALLQKKEQLPEVHHQGLPLTGDQLGDLPPVDGVPGPVGHGLQEVLELL